MQPFDIISCGVGGACIVVLQQSSGTVAQRLVGRRYVDSGKLYPENLGS